MDDKSMLTGASPDKTVMNRQRGKVFAREDRFRPVCRQTVQVGSENVPRKCRGVLPIYPVSLTRPAFLPFPAAGVS